MCVCVCVCVCVIVSMLSTAENHRDGDEQSSQYVGARERNIQSPPTDMDTATELTEENSSAQCPAHYSTRSPPKEENVSKA